jgi:hypothetical protein
MFRGVAIAAMRQLLWEFCRRQNSALGYTAGTVMGALRGWSPVEGVANPLCGFASGVFRYAQNSTLGPGGAGTRGRLPPPV